MVAFSNERETSALPLANSSSIASVGATASGAVDDTLPRLSRLNFLRDAPSELTACSAGRSPPFRLSASVRGVSGVLAALVWGVVAFAAIFRGFVPVAALLGVVAAVALLGVVAAAALGVVAATPLGVVATAAFGVVATAAALGVVTVTPLGVVAVAALGVVAVTPLCVAAAAALGVVAVAALFGGVAEATLLGVVVAVMATLSAFADLGVTAGIPLLGVVVAEATFGVAGCSGTRVGDAAWAGEAARFFADVILATAGAGGAADAAS